MRFVMNVEELEEKIESFVSREKPHIQEYFMVVFKKWYMKNKLEAEKTIKRTAKSVPTFEGFCKGERIYQLPILVQQEGGDEVLRTAGEDHIIKALNLKEAVFADLWKMMEFLRDVTPVLEYLRETYPEPRNLTMMSFPDIQTKTEVWQIEKARKREEQRTARRERLKTSSLSGTVPIATVDFENDGKPVEWILVNLTTEEALQYEADKQHHCVDDEDPYVNGLKNKALMIWSLRTSLMDPLLTITMWLQPRIEIGQILGLMNRYPTTTELCVLLTLFKEFERVDMDEEFYPLAQKASKMKAEWMLMSDLPEPLKLKKGSKLAIGGK